MKPKHNPKPKCSVCGKRKAKKERRTRHPGNEGIEELVEQILSCG